MNKNVRIIATVIFGILAYFCARPFGMYMYNLLNPKPKPWGVEYTKSVYNTLDSSFTATLTNSEQRTQAVRCVIDKLKKTLPNGLESVSKDSLYRLSYAYSSDCARAIKNVEATIKWTAEGEAGFRKAFIKKFDGSNITPDVKNNLCDCVLLELKSDYPEGMRLPLPEKQVDSITLKCVSKFKNPK